MSHRQELYAALKRRSSTALPAFTGLRASATTGLKPSASSGALRGAEAPLFHGTAGSYVAAGKCDHGAEAQRELLELNGALKRRSSTALPAAT
ncbi:MAG: hypothetical protein ABR880_03600 [Candidatus Sulfotelmatobacter sp.]